MRNRPTLLICAVAITVLAGSAAWAQTRFPDVLSDHPAAEDIIYAVNRGWFEGYPDGTFRPDHKLTSAQAATVFGRAIPDQGISRGWFATFLRAGAEALEGPAPDEACATWELRETWLNPVGCVGHRNDLPSQSGTGDTQRPGLGGSSVPHQHGLQTWLGTASPTNTPRRNPHRRFGHSGHTVSVGG